MGEKAKTHLIAFRVTDSEWEKIEEATEAAGEENPNEWSRKQVLSSLAGPNYLTRNERLLYEEMAHLRYLLGHGLLLAAKEELTEENWSGVLVEAGKNTQKIADYFIALRSRKK